MSALHNSASGPVIGETIGARYVLEKKLGEGSQGTAWAARDLTSNQLVALKQLHSDPELFSALAHEFANAAGLQHDHIARVIDFAADGAGGAYYTMELLTARDFDVVCASYPRETTLRLAMQILSALECLRRHGMLHGDLKPSNVLVTEDGEPSASLVDFGLAGRAGATGLTGTPAYMAPELATGGARDIRSDLYSLGVMLYETLAGHNPFLAKTPAGCIERHATLEPEPLHAVVDGLDMALGAFVGRLLAKVPARRFGSPAAALQALTRLTDGESSANALASACIVMTPPLVGRQRELDVVEAQLAQLASGTGAVVLMTGPLGIGKSAVLAEVRNRIHLSGARFGVATCGPGCAGLDAIKTALTQATGRADDGDPVGAVADALAAGPLVLAFEHIHLATDELQGGMARLIRMGERRPLAILLTSESAPGAPDRRAATLAAQRATVREYGALLTLDPLSETACAAVLEGALGAPADPDGVVKPLYAASDGSPLALLELLRYSADEGGLSLRQGVWSATGGARLFENGGSDGVSPLSRIVSQRCATLPQEALKLLEALAILETPSDVATIARLANETELVAGCGLNALGRLHLVAADGVGRYGLAHAGVHTSVRESMTTEQAQELNRRAAVFLMKEDGAAAVRIAGHCLAGGLVDEALASVPVAVEQTRGTGELAAAASLLSDLAALLQDRPDSAGRRLDALVEAGRLQVGLGLYQEALATFDEVLVDSAALDVQQRLDVLGGRAQALRRLGRPEESHACARQLLDELREDLDRETTVRACLAAAQVFRVGNAWDDATAALQLGFHSLGNDASPRFKAQLLLEQATLQWQQSDPTAAKLTARRAVVLFDAQSDDYGLAEATMTLGTAHRLTGDHVDALECYELAVETFERAGAIATLGKCHNNMGVCHYHRGSWERATEHWEEAVRIAELTAEVHEQTILLNNLGFMYLERGILRRADQAFREGLALATQSGSERLQIIIGGNLGETRARCGDSIRARQAYKTAIELAERLNMQCDALENRRRHIELLLDDGDLENAGEQARVALGQAQRLDLAGEIAHLRRILGIVKTRQRRFDQAEDHLLMAIDALDGDEDSLDAGAVAMARAEFALEKGDAYGARDLADRALVIFESLEAAWHLHRCRTLHRRIMTVFITGGVGATESARDDLLGCTVEALASETHPRRCARMVLEAALRVAKADRGTFYLPPSADGDEVRVSALASGHSFSEWTGTVDGLSQTVAARALETGETVCLRNIDDDESIASAASVVAMNIRSVLCVPVRIDDDRRGILYLDSRRYVDGGFESARRSVEQLAAALGMALHRCRQMALFDSHQEVMSMIAHELRSPINAIMGFAELVQARCDVATLPPEVSELVEMAVGQGARMNRLIGDIHDLSAALVVNTSKTTEQTAGALIEEAVRAAGPAAATKSVMLREVPADEPMTVLADRERVLQVLGNLINNAIRHSPAGRAVTIAAALEPFTRAVGERPMVRFAVTDHGAGVTAADRERIFKKFNRGTRPVGEGSGLGLNISETLINAHGGRLWVDSEPGEGACFAFTLPAGQIEETP